MLMHLTPGTFGVEGWVVSIPNATLGRTVKVGAGKLSILTVRGKLRIGSQEDIVRGSVFPRGDAVDPLLWCAIEVAGSPRCRCRRLVVGVTRFPTLSFTSVSPKSLNSENSPGRTRSIHSSGDSRAARETHSDADGICIRVSVSRCTPGTGLNQNPESRRWFDVVVGLRPLKS